MSPLLPEPCYWTDPPFHEAVPTAQGAGALCHPLALTAIVRLVRPVPTVVLGVAFPPERDALVVLADKLIEGGARGVVQDREPQKISSPEISAKGTDAVLTPPGIPKS